MANDVIIIGGGVIGCSIALRLAGEGMKVTLLEQGRIGMEASFAAAGMLAPQSDATARTPFFDLCFDSRSIYSDFAREVAERSGIDSQYKDEGTLCIEVEGERDALEWAAWQTEAGLPSERLTASAVQALEPAVTKLASGAVFIPGDHQVENRLLMRGLDVAIRRAGVEVIEGAQARRIIVERSKATGVDDGATQYRAGLVVVAAGSWTSRLLDPLGIGIEIIPARGQMLALEGQAMPINHIVHTSRCYLVPRRDGRVLVGATVEYVGFEKGVTAAGINSLLTSAIQVVPALAGFGIVETWSGLRPDTPDHLPVIGPSGIDNLILATGHFRNGILLAPLTADLIKEMIASGATPGRLKPFGVERFDRADCA
jgi:glycine oxidase